MGTGTDSITTLFERRFSDPERRRKLDELVDASIERRALASSAVDPQRFLGVEVPARGQSTEDYLEYLFNEVVPHSVPVDDARFIGHMTTALPDFVDPLGRLLHYLNQNVVKVETSNAFTAYERQAIGMLHSIAYGCSPEYYASHVQNAQSSLGMIVSGGTLANVAALWCARNARFPARGDFRGLERAGLAAGLKEYGYSGAVVLASSLVHYSVLKAVDLLGFGRDALCKVPADERGRIRIDALSKKIRECNERNLAIVAVVGIAGTTETGAVDPLQEMAAICEAEKVHLHVDAAWGGPTLFSPALRDRLAGIERADSITIDGHKQLYLPMGIGLVLFRKPDLAAAVEVSADYIIRSGSADLGRRTLEGSRPAMAVFLHGALHIIGMQGYAELIESGCARAQTFANMVREQPGFELLGDPDLNIVVYRYRAPDRSLEQLNSMNVALQEKLRTSGNSFVSRTTLRHTKYGSDPGVVALRAVFANPLSEPSHLQASLQEQLAIGASLQEAG